jgi:hypothetical protein
MLDMQNRIEKLQKGEVKAYTIFASLMIVGIGLIAVGAHYAILDYVQFGQPIAMTSPIFLAVGILARRKYKQLKRA